MPSILAVYVEPIGYKFSPGYRAFIFVQQIITVYEINFFSVCEVTNHEFKSYYIMTFLVSIVIN